MSRQRQPESFAEHFLQLKSSYDAANSGSKYRRQRAGIQWQGSNADSHYTITQLLRMIEGSRDLDRNNPVIAQGFDRVVDAVHPKLYELEPQTGDAKLNEDLKARFVDWAEDADQCDAQGRRSFCEIARQSLRHTFVDGDPSLLMLEDGSLETLESHRMRGPSSSSAKLHLTAPLGIDVDARNKPTAYYFTKSDFGFGGGVKISDIAKYNARDPEGFRQVLHLFNQRRFSQNRGVPILASVFEMCGFFDDLEFTQLVKAQVSACFAILEEEQPEKSGPALASDAMAVLGTRTNETRSDGTTGINESLSPGMRIKSRNKITGFSPNVPNESFFQHIEHILTLIAINMGLPVQALLLEPKANFSAWRGAESKAREGFKAWQRWLIESLYCEVYRWKVRQWLVEDPALGVNQLLLIAAIDVASVQALVKTAHASLIQTRRGGDGLHLPVALVFIPGGIDTSKSVAKTAREVFLVAVLGHQVTLRAPPAGRVKAARRGLRGIVVLVRDSTGNTVGNLFGELVSTLTPQSRAEHLFGVAHRPCAVHEGVDATQGPLLHPRKFSDERAVIGLIGLIGDVRPGLQEPSTSLLKPLGGLPRGRFGGTG